MLFFYFSEGGDEHDNSIPNYLVCGYFYWIDRSYRGERGQESTQKYGVDHHLCNGACFLGSGAAMRKMIHRIKFIESPYRRDKGKPQQQPIKCSEYAKELMRIGAGWK